MLAIILLFVSFFFVALNAYPIIQGNITFHTDIARDFLLLENMLIEKKITLIGPHAGGISGVFHGPLWLYIHLPAFVLGGGNPVFVGYFWIFLLLTLLLVIFLIGRKLFDQTTALLTVPLIAGGLITATNSLLNPFGAIIFFPIFFYFFMAFISEQNIKNATITFFILGILIQFEMAFGIPMLFLFSLYFFYSMIRTKNLKLLLSPFILLLPLSTFILFDIRHGFLQFHSIINFISGTENGGKLKLSFLELLVRRFKGFLDGLHLPGTSYNPLLFVTSLAIILVSFVYKNNKRNIQFYYPYLLFIYLYVGFWIIALCFKGEIWGYYYAPFMPIFVLLFCSLYKLINKPLFLIFIAFLLFKSGQQGVSYIQQFTLPAEKQGVSMWAFNQKVADTVFLDTKETFGYFVFTPDLYGYSPRYAMNYTQKRFSNTISRPNTKETITYLLISPPSHDKNAIDPREWVKNDIKITGKPIKTFRFENGFIIEKYKLTSEEIKVAPNPLLIDTLLFR